MVKKSHLFYYIFPVVIFYLLFLFYPIIFNWVLSFFDWNGINPNIFENFFGIKNYINLFSDKIFLMSLENTLIFVLITVIFLNIIGFVLALVLHFGNFRFQTLIKSILFFPAILAPVVTSLIWKKFFTSDGLFNTLLHININWLGNLVFPIWIVIFVYLWQYNGWSFIIYSAGFQSLNTDLVEAAMLDGSNWSGIITKVIIPVMKPVIAINVMLTVIGTFKIFDLVYIITAGGPVHKSEVLTTYMYWLSFSAVGPNQMSYASTVIIGSLFIALIFGIFRAIILKKEA